MTQFGKPEAGIVYQGFEKQILTRRAPSLGFREICKKKNTLEKNISIHWSPVSVTWRADRLLGTFRQIKGGSGDGASLCMGLLRWEFGGRVRVLGTPEDTCM
jgi:hypothetical protein